MDTMNDLVKKVEELEARALQRRQERGGETKNNLVTLPIWPESTRGTPNAFLRGALFAAIQGKERRAMQRELLATQKGVTIRYTGWQLDQADLDVWEQAAQLAQSHPLGNVCHFHLHGFLKALGRDTGKSQHEWLKGSFARLMSAGVEISDGRYTYGGAMLEFKQDELVGAYVVRLNPTIFDLYKAGWTQVDWQIRRKLSRKPLALWLHGWLSSNAENFPTKIETLRELSGSKNKVLRGFKQKLQAALDELVTVDAIDGFSVEHNLVTIQRKPTATQEKHLVKKGRKPR
jgi:hypothetical protein